MAESQMIQNPFGITVFGSSALQVEPDIVSLSFAVARLQQHPRDAFQEVRNAAHTVRRYLEQVKIDEVNTSRVTLEQSFRYTASEHQFLGYTAKIIFHVSFHQLDKMEDVLAGLVDAGVNELHNVDFQTTKLKEIRAEARRQAIAAAREKAENYCNAAGIVPGRIIHIEDVNPDELLHRGIGHVESGRSGAAQAFDPGRITVSAAVVVCYRIEEKQP
jgi:uncharacterized protein YggE